MNRANGILVLILTGLVIMIVFVVVKPGQTTSVVTPPPTGLPQTQASNFETKTSDEGSVAIEVTPIVLSAGEKPKFNISFNTHSVELDFKVEEVTALTDDKGQTIGAPRWSGAPPGGHHRSGELDFDQALGQNAKGVTLTIEGVASVSKREFAWSLP